MLEMPRRMEIVKRTWDKLPGKEKCWIAGGALRSALLGERVRDFDIFSANPDAVIAAFKAGDMKLVNDSPAVANFKGPGGSLIQVIRKFTFESERATIEAFDFTAICAAFGPDGFVHHERFFIDNASRTLVVNALPFPHSSVSRALKYARRGYVVCPKALAQILKAVESKPINWENPTENNVEFYPDGTPKFGGLD